MIGVRYIPQSDRQKTLTVTGQKTHTLTVRCFLGRGVNSLPSSVAGRQIWPCHPHVVPDVEVPDGVESVLGIVPGGELLAVVREELVHREARVCVVGGNVIGHGATRQAQGSAD